MDAALWDQVAAQVLGVGAGAANAAINRAIQPKGKKQKQQAAPVYTPPPPVPPQDTLKARLEEDERRWWKGAALVLLALGLVGGGVAIARSGK